MRLRTRFVFTAATLLLLLSSKSSYAIEILAEDPDEVEVRDKVTLECEVRDLDDGLVPNSNRSGLL